MDQPEGVGKGVWRLPDPGPVYLDLAKLLKKHGFTEAEASITNKLKRGTFSAAFFLACIAALESEGVALDEI
jgi:Domain of unknown function (DUF6471)